MPWMDQECASNGLFRSVVDAFTGFSYASGAARFSGGSFTGDYSPAKVFGVAYNELLPMYQGGTPANRRCVWWMLAPRWARRPAAPGCSHLRPMHVHCSTE